MIHPAFEGKFELIPLEHQLLGDLGKHLRELFDDLGGDVSVGREDFRLGDGPVGADQSQDKRRDGERSQTHFRVGKRNTRGHLFSIDSKGLPTVRDVDHHETVVERALYYVVPAISQ